MEKNKKIKIFLPRKGDSGSAWGKGGGLKGLGESVSGLRKGGGQSKSDGGLTTR